MVMEHTSWALQTGCTRWEFVEQPTIAQITLSQAEVCLVLPPVAQASPQVAIEPSQSEPATRCRRAHGLLGESQAPVIVIIKIVAGFDLLWPTLQASRFGSRAYADDSHLPNSFDIHAAKAGKRQYPKRWIETAYIGYSCRQIRLYRFHRRCARGADV